MPCLLERSFTESVLIAQTRQRIREEFSSDETDPEKLLETTFDCEVRVAKMTHEERKDLRSESDFSVSEERGPTLWIVGGINGSGKTTLCNGPRLAPLFRTSQVLNADLLARTLRMVFSDLSQDEADRRAATLIFDTVVSGVNDGRSLAVETVLSTDKYKPVVDNALKRGVRFGFVYLTLDSPEEAIARVSLRVRGENGHDVPAEKIRDRWARSHDNWRWFAERAHFGIVFDNGGSRPQKTILVRDGHLLYSKDLSEEWESRISTLPKHHDFRISEEDVRWEPGF